MIVQGIDHVNIRVREPAATLAFFAQVLGMTPHFPAPGRSIGGGGWLLDGGGRAVVHVGAADGAYPTDAWRPFDGEVAGGPVHHVALSCRGHAETLARLEAGGLEHRADPARADGLRQIFVAEPGGVLLELNFRGD